MPTKLRWMLALGAIVALALTVSACGSDSSSSTTSGSSENGEFAPSTAAPSGAQQGGDLTVIAASDVDYIDPGAAYYQFTFMVTSATQSSLEAYAPPDVEEPTPLLASAAPTISDDGKTVTYTLRDDVMYSPAPPDGDQSWKPRAATAADVKYAIERSVLPGIPNGFVQTYLAGVDGFDKAVKEAQADPTGGAPDISGITAPDDTTLVIKLDDTSSLGVIGALTLPVSAPVPEEYAKQYDTLNPSTYGEHQLSSGPYMIENNAAGELTGYTPNKEIHLVRNPNWKASDADFRPAYLDDITIQEGFADTVSAGKKVLDGSAEVNGDFSAPPSVIKQAATEGDPGQLTVTPSGGNRYIALNTQKPPFDDINIRKAVIAGSNRTDLRNTRGGELVGPVATHYLPPGFAGFEEAGGVNGPDLDFIQNPNGDAQVSADYFKKAGMSSGKCEGDCDITMVGDDAPPGSDTATVLKDELENLGFNVSYQKVAHDVMYTKFCNVPETEPEVCPNVGWLKDFQDPQSILQITFNGEAIVPSNNSNWPLLDVPEVNKAIDQAVYVDDPDARAEAWGKIDDQIMEQAPAIPWVWDNQANIESGDVAGVINQFNANWDLSYTSVK